MATSSIWGGKHVPEPVKGKDTDALGPSDNSDSGSDSQGVYGGDELSSDSDAEGTGERTSAGFGFDGFNADILPDHIEGPPYEDAQSEDTPSDQLDDTRGVESLIEDDADILDDEDDLRE